MKSAIALAAMVVVLAGCSAATPVVSGTPQATNPGASQQAPTVARFGQQHTWPDGLSVSVSAPEPYRPSQTSTAPPGARVVVVTVTLTNGSQAPLDAQGTVVRATAGDQPAEQIFDAANNVMAAPASTVLPGKSLKFRAAFQVLVDGPAEMQIEVAPAFGFAYQPAIFVGSL